MKLVRLAALAGAIWYLRDARRRQELVDRLKSLFGRGDQLAPGADRPFEGNSATPEPSEARPQDVVAPTPSG
jgi:hypothetical protein